MRLRVEVLGLPLLYLATGKDDVAGEPGPGGAEAHTETVPRPSVLRMGFAPGLPDCPVQVDEDRTSRR